MTRFIHDQFAKDYLEELLSPYGEVQAPRRVAGEVRQIDVWFAPTPSLTADMASLGLLGRFATSTAMIEPFRNPATPAEICDCVLKLLEFRGELQRSANRNNRNLQESNLPKLWILTPTASVPLLSGFGATLKEDWLPGIYFMPEYLRTAIVAIHQLPRTLETLWLRILGRGTVQKQAIEELEALPADNRFRENALELLYSLQKNLEVTQDLDEDDRELIMRLAPLYQQEKEQSRQEGIQQGVQQGQRLVVENLLKFRFGSLDDELRAIIEPLLALTPEEFTPLIMQLSRAELLARFREQERLQLLPLYEQQREQAIREGIQQGKRLVVENLLQFRFGSLDEELLEIVEPFLALPDFEFNQLFMEIPTLEREELLARFRQAN